MERGKIWLPEQAAWLDEFETELFAGLPTRRPGRPDRHIGATRRCTCREKRGSEIEVSGAHSIPQAFSLRVEGFSDERG